MIFRNLTDFYCYVNDAGFRMVDDIKPDNFNQLTFNRCFKAPNKTIAEMTYEIDYKLWLSRKGENDI
jgi:hypothetical protein